MSDRPSRQPLLGDPRICVSEAPARNHPANPSSHSIPSSCPARPYAQTTVSRYPRAAPELSPVGLRSSDMYRDLSRLHASAAVGRLCATPLAFNNLHNGHLFAATGWGLPALRCLAILLGPSVIKGAAEKRNPSHDRHSTGKTR
jgi:hypothetical protein